MICESRKGIVSIHDVMPETLTAVQRCLDICRQSDVEAPYLLVVPGAGWTGSQLSQLRQWSDEGCQLAGHGWTHRAQKIAGVYHRLHSALISRQVAEHLALNETDRVHLMRRCHDWFEANGLPSPALYVPPAWALGRVAAGALSSTGFRYVETTRGVLDITCRQWLAKPLLGYEADTILRVNSLKLWNGVNRLRARRAGHLRLAIHPFDLEYGLQHELLRDLELCHAITLEELDEFHTKPLLER